jgi:hypothetical protein
MALPVLAFDREQERLECAGDKVLHTLVQPASSFGLGVLCDDSVGDNTATIILGSIASSYSARNVERFDDVLNATVEALNRIYRDGKLERTKQQTDDLVEHLCTTTLPAVLDRHQKIEKLVQQTDKLRTTTVSYRQSAVTVKHVLCFQDKKFVVLVIFLICVVIYVTLSVFCGGLLLPSCSEHKAS